MKLIIAGGRDFNSIATIASACKTLFHHPPTEESEGYYDITEVVCGMARGADLLGAIWANNRNIPVKEFPADWDTHGKAAGPIRNKQMGDYADVLLAFWNGKSTGTKHMIDYMTSLGKPVWVRMYKK